MSGFGGADFGGASGIFPQFEPSLLLLESSALKVFKKTTKDISAAAAAENFCKFISPVRKIAEHLITKKFPAQ